MKKDISILCANKDSNYYYFKGIDIYDNIRNAFTFNNNNPVICHPPCAQWSKMKGLATYNKNHIDLAFFCLDKLNKNGGILEHPYNSDLIKYIRDNYDIIEKKIYLSWFGFNCPKPTSLIYFKNTFIIDSTPRINTFFIDSEFYKLNKNQRSETPILLCQYLIDSIRLNKVNEDQDKNVNVILDNKVNKDRPKNVNHI